MGVYLQEHELGGVHKQLLYPKTHPSMSNSSLMLHASSSLDNPRKSSLYSSSYCLCNLRRDLVNEYCNFQGPFQHPFPF